MILLVCLFVCLLVCLFDCAEQIEELARTTELKFGAGGRYLIIIMSLFNDVIMDLVLFNITIQ